MRAVKAQIECRAAHDPPLDAERCVVREVHTEKIDRQIAAMQEKGRACAFYGNIAVHAVRERGTPVDRQSCSIRPLPVNAEIGVQCAARPLGQGRGEDAQICERDIIRRQMRRIGCFFHVKDTCARECPAECLRRQILERYKPVRIGDIRRRILERDIIHSPLCSTEPPLCSKL